MIIASITATSFNVRPGTEIDFFILKHFLFPRALSIPTDSTAVCTKNKCIMELSAFHLLIGLIIFLSLNQLTKGADSIVYPDSPPSCNVTLYKSWRAEQYLGYLSTDPNFWRYQTQTQFVLTKGLALELVVAKCTDKFKLLYEFKAGRSGPIDIQHSYKSMCSDVCIEADRMSLEALTISGCSCEDLSTQPSSPYYKRAGDWCESNSARLLCNTVGYCGVWNCRIGDFMCPRYEWNKKYVLLKGPGTCNRNSASRTGFAWAVTAGAVLALAMYLVI